MAGGGWRLGRGRRVAKARSRRAPAPQTPADLSGRVANRLDDASFVAAHYDEAWDPTHWTGPVSDRLQRSAWTIRYLGAGRRFRARMLRTIVRWAIGTLVAIVVVLGLSWLVG